MISGYKLFKTYYALQLHFTSKYDILKYGSNGKRFSKEIYDKRKDRLRFENFAKKLSNQEEVFYFCVSNFIHNDVNWLYRELNESFLIYTEWKGYLEGFKYKFSSEYSYIKGEMESNGITLNDMLKQTKSGNKPPLLQMLLHGKITPEFICIVDERLDFINKWLDMYKGIDPYIEDKLQLLTRYRSLVTIIFKRYSNKSE